VIWIFLRSSSPRWLLRGYRWVTAEYVYCIHEDDPKHHSQTITILLEATQRGIDHFENRYLWSAHGREEELKLISPGHTLMGPIIQRNQWKYYYVHLGHELEIGERVEVKVHQELYDENNTFEPYLAKTIVEPVDRLLLRALFPKQHLPAHCTFYEMNTSGPANMVIRKIPSHINHHLGEVHWDISSPVFGHKYQIHWSY
jgi:hypothetical protein